jgi:hypothetical protein
MNLFDYADRYPQVPGFKEPTTSREAAVSVKPRQKEAHAKILALLARYPEGLTADEIAAHCDWTEFFARPRVSELKRLKMIEPTGRRRPNASGANAKVWQLKKQEQVAA